MMTDAERAAAERAALLEIRAGLVQVENGLSRWGRVVKSRYALLGAKLLGAVRLQLESEHDM